MIQLIKELNTSSKKTSKKVRAITIYNIINFLLTIALSAGLSIFSFVISEEITNENHLLIIFLPLVFVLINYYVLTVNKRFINGSIKAYWILLIFLCMQCVAIKIGEYSFELNLGSIPIYFSLNFGKYFLQINIVPIIFTLYLINVREEYFNYSKKLQQTFPET